MEILFAEKYRGNEAGYRDQLQLARHSRYGRPPNLQPYAHITFGYTQARRLPTAARLVVRETDVRGVPSDAPRVAYE